MRNEVACNGKYFASEEHPKHNISIGGAGVFLSAAKLLSKVCACGLWSEDIVSLAKYFPSTV